MKQGKQLTTGKRIIFFILVILVLEVALFVAGFFMGYFEAAGLNEETLLFVTRMTASLGFGLLFYLLHKSFTSYKAYQTSEGTEDDEIVDSLYKTTFRSLEYATLVFNIVSSLTVFNIVLGTSVTDAGYNLSTFDVANFLVLLPAQIATLKVTQVIRQYKLSAFATPNEVRDYMYALDEGEKQANFEQSFLILFNLNQWVFPLLYVLVAMVSTITQTQQLLALGIVAFLHLYINLTKLSMIYRYFK
ncbi:TPA: DUF3169 family protein [Streptococcus suis 2651]|uniref:DUF3169 family protein n=1 Tax=Streptococcus suis TaxID=1307 RepID=UPI0003FAFA76|nr:DUF3169 family protein [Streptococcus suis]HEL1669459.1 DUF3169 family protein [Streptococcus suis]HEL1754925.1 DUF3169 family protein [Streptococcus suis]HEM3220767.1 DUF3169 family protein [Streptococcus suis 2651]